jgi:hypothetical protein
MRVGNGSQRLLIVSSDGHVGPPVGSYRGYMDPAYRADYDDWLAQYVPMCRAFCRCPTISNQSSIFDFLRPNLH